MLITLSDSPEGSTDRVDRITEATRLVICEFPDIDTEDALIFFEIQNLREGVTGDVLDMGNNEFEVRLNSRLSDLELERTVAHEVTHVMQYLRGDTLESLSVEYEDRLHEQEAFAIEAKLYPA